ncbi:hypothetical protein J3A83DRAFT_2923263 [Scleroderma citrinum]
MSNRSIRLYSLDTKSVQRNFSTDIEWNRVWAVSYVWDNKGKVHLPVPGCNWESAAFSDFHRFEKLLGRASQIAGERGGRYLWIDCLCINQEDNEDKAEQISNMWSIFSRSAGTIAFASLTQDNSFAQLIHTYEDGKKAWLADWFERVWTYQELHLPHNLVFVSGEQELTSVRSGVNDIYTSILLMSPYLTPPNADLSHIQQVLNGVSPSAYDHTQRALMQARVRYTSMPCDRVYGILGALKEPMRHLHGYGLSENQALIQLMKLMSHTDILDTLTFNTIPTNSKHDGENWSGMMDFSASIEHPSYAQDEYHGRNARIDHLDGRIITAIDDAEIWKVKITEEQLLSASNISSTGQDWPHIESVAAGLGITGDFSEVEMNPSFTDIIGRAARSLRANSDIVSPLISVLHLQAQAQTTAVEKIPTNRLGNPDLFDKEVMVVVCRSKKMKEGRKPYHYGICVEPNEDGTWHKICTASFSGDCEVLERRKHNIMIGA